MAATWHAVTVDRQLDGQRRTMFVLARGGATPPVRHFRNEAGVGHFAVSGAPEADLAEATYVVELISGRQRRESDQRDAVDTLLLILRIPSAFISQELFPLARKSKVIVRRRESDEVVLTQKYSGRDAESADIARQSIQHALQTLSTTEFEHEYGFTTNR